MKAELVTIRCVLCGASEFTEVYEFSLLERRPSDVVVAT